MVDPNRTWSNSLTLWCCSFTTHFMQISSLSWLHSSGEMTFERWDGPAKQVHQIVLKWTLVCIFCKTRWVKLKETRTLLLFCILDITFFRLLFFRGPPLKTTSRWLEASSRNINSLLFIIINIILDQQNKFKKALVQGVRGFMLQKPG